MLSSLLERSSKRIILDRVVKSDNADIMLVNKEKKVLEEVQRHFKVQFQKRNVQEENIPRKWIKIYNLIQEINSEIYCNLDNSISEEEWTEALKNTKPKSALGPLGISYPLIKKVGPLVQKVFRYLANICIHDGEILIK